MCCPTVLQTVAGYLRGGIRTRSSSAARLSWVFFPGILDELVASGAPVCDDGDLSKAYMSLSGHVLINTGRAAVVDDKPTAMYLPSRPLEDAARRRLSATDNVAIAEGLDVAAPLVQHKMPSSQWRRYDKMRRNRSAWLGGWRRDLPGFPRVEGRRTPDMRLISRFVDRILTACESDAIVAAKFSRVSGHVDPPTRLFIPSFVLRLALIISPSDNRFHHPMKPQRPTEPATTPDPCPYELAAMQRPSVW
jgi:hypothetical protein